MNMASALRELIGENDRSESDESQAGSDGTSPGGALFEVIRLLTKMASEERTTLIELLKAFG